MKNAILFTLILTLIFTCYPQQVFTTELTDIALEKVPAWVNLFNWRGDREAFDMRKLAEVEKITLREAAEVQNHYLDLCDDRDDKRDKNIKFQEALKRVKTGLPGGGDKTKKYEDVWNQEAIDKAKFIVVFDLDDTLLNQYYCCGIKGKEFYDIKTGDKNFNYRMEPGRFCFFL
jgi:hypothetical protein